LLFACNNKSEYPDNSQGIKELVFKNNFNKYSQLSEFLDVEKVIPLQLTDSSIVGKVDKVILLEDLSGLLVLDKTSAQKVFHFSDNGKYLGQIGSKGHGPTEYSELTELVVYGNKIYILDKSAKKVLVYTKDHGFYRSINISFIAYDFCVLNEHEFLFYSSGEYENIVTNDKGKIAIKSMQKDLRWKGIQSNSIIETSKYVTFRSQFSDTLYSWELSELYSSPSLYKLHLPKPIVKLDKFLSFANLNGPDGLPTYPVSSEYISPVYNIFHMDKYIYLVYAVEGVPYYCILNKKTGSTIAFSNRVVDNLSFQKWAPQIRGAANNDILMAVIYPDKTKDLESFNLRHSTNININSNPVIVSYKIR